MIPEKFAERMKEMLGDGYERFAAALEREAVKGARVNEGKISVGDFLALGAFEVEALSYAKDGFILKNSDGVGLTPEHHAGMIYVQDPGAMATVNALDVKEGWRVLDACSAPGGKSSQLSQKIGEGGLLISNEFVPKRAKIIVSNFERLGIKNALILSQDTAKFKEMFGSEISDETSLNMTSCSNMLDSVIAEIDVTAWKNVHLPNEAFDKFEFLLDFFAKPDSSL